MKVFHITIALMLGITMLPLLIMLLDLFKTCYLLSLDYLGMLNELKNYKAFQIVLLLKQNTNFIQFTHNFSIRKNETISLLTFNNYF